jgi:hypothetical protein
VEKAKKRKSEKGKNSERNLESVSIVASVRHRRLPMQETQRFSRLKLMLAVQQDQEVSHG